MKKILLWTLTLIIAISTMVYQRLTGPTYPKKVETSINGKNYNFRLLRSNEIGTPCKIQIPMEDEEVHAKLFYKRYKTDDAWTAVAMSSEVAHERAFFGKGEEIKVLSGTLPEQGPAGKVEYYIELYHGDKSIALRKEEPVIVRFKGKVSKGILYPHIAFMVISLIFGVRAGLEALAKGKNTYRFSVITLITLSLGGLFFGPIVQFQAFGDYWTGWPFGNDWTDTKTFFAAIFWLIAFFQLKKNPKNRLWPLVALMVLFSIYLIPHSMGGSELNPETGQVETGL